VVPHSPALAVELEARCHATGLNPADWVRIFRHEKRIMSEPPTSKPYQSMTPAERVADRISKNS